MFLSRIRPIPLCLSIFHTTNNCVLIFQDLRQAHLSHAGCFSFSFLELLEVEGTILPSKSTYKKAQFSSMMCLFNQNAHDIADSYIYRPIPSEGLFLWRIRKNFDPEEEIAKRAVFIGKDACKELKPPLQRRSLQEH